MFGVLQAKHVGQVLIVHQAKVKIDHTQLMPIKTKNPIKVNM